MYVNALHIAVLPPKWLNFGSFLLRYSSTYSRQGPLSGALKTVQAARSYAHRHRRYRSGASRPAVSSGRFLASIPWMSFLSTEPREGLVLLAPETKEITSVSKRRCWDFESSGVVKYIVAAWLTAGGENGKSEV